MIAEESVPALPRVLPCLVKARVELRGMSAISAAGSKEAEGCEAVQESLVMCTPKEQNHTKVVSKPLTRLLQFVIASLGGA